MTTPARSWFEEDGTLLRLRLTRPKANILDAEMIGAISGELEKHSGKPNSRAPAELRKVRILVLEPASRNIFRNSVSRCCVISTNCC